MGHSTTRFHVVSGGPGSGKSTLLDALAAAGLSRTVEACRTYEAMARVYRRLGYRLVEVPRVSVEERARFVRAHLGPGAQPLPE